MSNFLQDILTELGREEVEAVRFDALIYPWSEDDPRNKGIILGKLYSMEEASPLVDYEYDSEYGGTDCQDIMIWTKERIYFIHEYDGSTRIDWLDRNPREVES